MKKKLLITITTIILLAIGFLVVEHIYKVYQRENSERVIPTGTVEYFNVESEKIIKIFQTRSNSMNDLNDDEKKLLKSYFDKYVNNPRLSDEQDMVSTNIMMMDVFYSDYLNKKDSTKKSDIKDANTSIENFFSLLKRLEKEQQ